MLALGAGLLWAATALAQQGKPDWDAAENTTLVDEAGRPVDIAIAPDGELWWADMNSGNVTRHDPATGERSSAFHRAPIEDPAERGLVGLALDPDVAENGIFYVYYTVGDPEDPEGGTNVLSRIEDGREHRLVNVSANVVHNGGRIEFDDKGRMFVSTGDNNEGRKAQDPGSRLGKILHLYPNGTPAEDTIEGYVYSIGHRNVYGLAYDEANDRLFATENGEKERDEINLVEPGNNHGWPECEGYHRYDYDRWEPIEEPCDEPAFTDPIGVFHNDTTAAPTGAAMFHGDLYWASLNEAAIHRLSEDPAGGWTDTVVHETAKRAYDVEVHNGSLYYSQPSEVVRLDVPVEAATGQAPSGSALSEVAGPGLAAAASALALAVAVGRRRR